MRARDQPLSSKDAHRSRLETGLHDGPDRLRGYHARRLPHVAAASPRGRAARQAGVAVHLARKRGDEISPALLAIAEAGADAARELRATLGVLRSRDEDDGSGLDRLPALMGRTRSAGLAASVTVTGTPSPLLRDVNQAAYRIVQEALTNVTRHAGQASAIVHLCYGPDALTVQVNDDGTAGPQPAVPGPGLGLIGMRERVASLGGLLQAGPRRDGGFRVWAELPLRAPA